MASENHQQRASLTVKSNRKQAVFSFSWLSMIHWLWQLFYFLLIMEFVNGADRCLIETVMWAESDQDETRVKADPLTLIHESRTDDVRGRCVCLGVSLLQHTHTHTHMQRHVRNEASALSRMHAHICALERKHTSDTQIFLAHPPPLEIQATDVTRNDQRRSQDGRWHHSGDGQSRPDLSRILFCT